ncbi:hypothetical protein HMPREF1978_01736 [Actinomyces graevenitzii F0530]|uniref:Uncharacterized protein n=1 Tax=Actinomyces graevenitzii F0530 TaxID=1321817 RepID=U1R3V8_9ACTO|nr:hypothetical protein HMPREF1978_01736 [Actinomyces graevenitzii F0530]
MHLFAPVGLLNAGSGWGIRGLVKAKMLVKGLCAPQNGYSGPRLTDNLGLIG